MSHTSLEMAVKAGVACRNVAVLLIAGVCRWRTAEDVNDAIKARPLREQVLITGGVLAILFLSSFFAAQLGWIAVLIFWLAVILIAN